MSTTNTILTFSTYLGASVIYGSVTYNFDPPTGKYVASPTSIAASAFLNVTTLIAVTIGSNVTSIGISAFSGCTNLATVLFDGVPTINSIGNFAFNHTLFSTIIIPDSVTQLGENVFHKNSALIYVTNSSPTITTALNSISAIFDSSYNSSSAPHFFTSTSSSYPLYQYVQTFYPNVILSPTSCFNEGTLILTKSGYVEIENIKIGDEVLTYHQMYKKVTHIVKQKFGANNNEFDKFMCKYKCENYPDLLITGGHSLMVDELSDEMKEYVKDNEYYIYSEDGKYRMLAGLDDKCEKIVDGIYNVYHLVLDGDDDLDLWYWIYSNGMVTETMSEKCYSNLVGNC